MCPLVLCVYTLSLRKKGEMAEEASYKEVNEFIRRELDKHGEWLVDVFIEQLEKNGNVITGQLLDSLNWNLYDPKDGSAAGLEVGFETLGHAVDSSAIIMTSPRSRKMDSLSFCRNATASAGFSPGSR